MIDYTIYRDENGTDGIDLDKGEKNIDTENLEEHTFLKKHVFESIDYKSVSQSYVSKNHTKNVSDQVHIKNREETQGKVHEDNQR